jgi:HEAT repeat protein
MLVAMLFSELEGSTLEELIDAFRGPPLDGEEYRVSFYDDVADAIARLGGIDFLEGELDQDDDDRMAAAIGALAFSQDLGVDKRRLNIRLRSLLDHPNPNVVITAIDSLRRLEDWTVHDRVLELFHRSPGMIRARALIYLSVLFPDEALPLLLDALNDPDATIRFTAVDQLDELQFTDRATFERMIDDPDEDVRGNARYILDNHFLEPGIAMTPGGSPRK